MLLCDEGLDELSHLGLLMTRQLARVLKDPAQPARRAAAARLGLGSADQFGQRDPDGSGQRFELIVPQGYGMPFPMRVSTLRDSELLRDLGLRKSGGFP